MNSVDRSGSFPVTIVEPMEEETQEDDWFEKILDKVLDKIEKRKEPDIVEIRFPNTAKDSEQCSYRGSKFHITVKIYNKKRWFVVEETNKTINWENVWNKVAEIFSEVCDVFYI